MELQSEMYCYIIYVTIVAYAMLMAGSLLFIKIKD